MNLYLSFIQNQYASVIRFPVSEEIEMRAYQEEDAAMLYQTIMAQKAYLRPWIAWVDRVQTFADAQDVIRQGRYQTREQRAMPLAVFYKGNLAGGIGLHDWNHELQSVKIGYWLVENLQGQGLMLQCGKVFIDFLFQKLKLHKVMLDYFPENIKSAALAQRLGFTIEGVLRDATRYHGRYRDLVICGMLRDEWQAGNP